MHVAQICRAFLALAAAMLLSAVFPGTGSAYAATTTLCSEQTASVAGGTYIVQNNEYDSSASECVTTDGGADFTVANSGIANSTSGSPGSYPSIYQGCHWGLCSSGGLSSNPIQVSALTPGKVTSSWSTTQPGSGSYDVSYDIWFNKTPTTTGQPNCTELMVWLNHNGSVQPFGGVVASNVSVGGHTYNIWEGQQSVWNTISYDMTSGTTSVSNLDIGALAQDAVSRGYLSSSCYLIDVEAGFELWQGGAGLATNSFSVNVNSGSSGSPSPSPSPSSASPSASPTPSPTSTGASGACSAAYSVTSSWPGGFQGQLTITNTRSAALNGWTAAWTFPGNQQISSLWNGVASQSGSHVTVNNASYNASIAPGSSVTIGFIATYSGTNASPTAFTLNGAACG